MTHGPHAPRGVKPDWSKSYCLPCSCLSPDKECLADTPNGMPAGADMVYCPWRTTTTAQLSALQLMGET